MTLPTHASSSPVATSVQGEEEEEGVVHGSVGWLNRAAVRKRVYAGMTPGQKRQKHVIATKEFVMEGRQWVWEYWNNYKAATCLFSLIGIMVALYTIIVQLGAMGAQQDETLEYWSFCDWTSTVACSPVFGSVYWHGFGLVAPILGSDSWWNLPNGLYAIIYYIAQIILCEKKGPKFVKIQLVLSSLANGLALYLGFAILSRLQMLFCPLAVVQCLLNAAILVANMARWNAIKRVEAAKKN